MIEPGNTLFPEARAKEGLEGTPVVLGDGNTWLLADGGLCNLLDDLRDRMFDDSELQGTVPMIDVQRAAMIMILANYDASEAEAASLVIRAEQQPLTDAVMESLFGRANGHMTYTMWATSALLANGIDPASVPTRFRPHVLNHLVETRRAIPASKLIDSVIAAPKLAAIRAAVKATADAKARREAEAEAVEPTEAGRPALPSEQPQ